MNRTIPKRLLRLSASVAALGLLHPVAAVAQMAPEQASDDAGYAQDIVVTAQKRTERLQDVPISIAVTTPTTLRDLGIRDTMSLQRAVPGVVIVQRNLNAVPYIRGIGADNAAAGDESPIAVYVDGVYRASSSASAFSLPNVERIEVLKGPQGTLFGRNATGGVISIVTKQPSQVASGVASVGYGNYNTVEGNAYLNVPLTSVLAANFTARYNERMDGWGKNVATGKDVYTLSSMAFDTKWMLDLDATTITLMADWSRDRWIGGPGQSSRTLPGRGSSIDGNDYYAGLYNVNIDGKSLLRLKNYGASLHVEHDFGAAQLLSISAYRVTNGILYGDSDATPVAFLDYFVGINDKAITQEFQLTSSPDSKLSWILGTFFLKTHQPVDQSQVFTNGAAVTRPFSKDLSRTTSYAAFAQATYPLGSHTKVTAGIRYTIDQKKHNFRANGGVKFVAPKETYKSPTWRLAVNHDLSEDVMVYASYNRGFKSGVYSTGNTNPAVKPSKVDAYEVGIKSEFLDRRVTFNLAGYYAKYHDIQIGTTVITPTGGSFRLFNAAGARFKGFDAELIVRPVDDLRLSASVSVLDGKYTDFTNAPGFQFAPNNRGAFRVPIDASGTETINSPPFSAVVSASYIVRSAIGPIQFSANSSYTSRYYGSVDKLIPTKRVNISGASVDWTSPDDRWNLRFWSNNIFNEHYVSLVLPRASGFVSTPGDPRSYGVTATAKF